MVVNCELMAHTHLRVNEQSTPPLPLHSECMTMNLL